MDASRTAWQMVLVLPDPGDRRRIPALNAQLVGGLPSRSAATRLHYLGHSRLFFVGNFNGARQVYRRQDPNFDPHRTALRPCLPAAGGPLLDSACRKSQCPGDARFHRNTLRHDSYPGAPCPDFLLSRAPMDDRIGRLHWGNGLPPDSRSH